MTTATTRTDPHSKFDPSTCRRMKVMTKAMVNNGNDKWHG